MGIDVIGVVVGIVVGGLVVTFVVLAGVVVTGFGVNAGGSEKYMNLSNEGAVE
jgi:hypothetical protein